MPLRYIVQNESVHRVGIDLKETPSRVAARSRLVCISSLVISWGIHCGGFTPMNNSFRTLLVLVCIAGLLALGVVLYYKPFSSAFDARLQAALTGVQGLHSYEMQDETRAILPAHIIEINGRYRLNFDAQRYESVSTTTLTMLEVRPPTNVHTFTLQHRSIADDIYVRIQTDSPVLQKTIPYGPQWRHFKSNAIPDRFIDIAVAGPILDNLALLRENGAYLSPTGAPVDISVASTTYHVYSFTLSKKATLVPDGPVRGLIDFIATGTIDVWIDDVPSVRAMRINGSTYVSTSTFSKVNTPLDISPPSVSE